MFHTHNTASTPQNTTPEDQINFVNNLYARNARRPRKKSPAPSDRPPHISEKQITPSIKTPYTAQMPQKSHSIRNAIFIICVTCIVIGLAGIAYLYISQDQQSITSVVEGADPSKTPDEIVQELNEKVPEGMMNIQIAPIFTTDENLTGDIDMINSKQNHFDQKLVLKDSADHILFESQFISPGQQLHDIQLRNPPDESASILIAEITGYDRTTHDVVGLMSVEIRYVQKGAQQ